MKVRHAIFGAIILAVATPAISMRTEIPPSQYMPTKTDIPDDLGGVTTCADAVATAAMFDNYFQNGTGTMKDIDLYFTGLKATNCVQTSGPMTILRVYDRKKLVDGSYILFEGKLPDGKIITAIVNENSVNTHPRTELERWKREHNPDGKLQTKDFYRPAYRCPSADAARNVVRAIPDPATQGLTKSKALRAFKNALKIQKCTVTKGTFDVIEVYEMQWIILGYEDGPGWTALKAVDDAGRTVGLIYDGSPF